MRSYLSEFGILFQNSFQTKVKYMLVRTRGVQDIVSWFFTLETPIDYWKMKNEHFFETLLATTSTTSQSLLRFDFFSDVLKIEKDIF